LMWRPRRSSTCTARGGRGAWGGRAPWSHSARRRRTSSCQDSPTRSGSTLPSKKGGTEGRPRAHHPSRCKEERKKNRGEEKKRLARSWINGPLKGQPALICCPVFSTGQQAATTVLIGNIDPAFFLRTTQRLARVFCSSWPYIDWLPITD
jgi:hypothetical protein